MFGLLLTFLLAAAAEGACDEQLTPQLKSVFDFEPRLAMSDLLPTISDACTLAAKQKVLFIGVDGFRADAAGMLPLPNIQKLQASGAATAASGPLCNRRRAPSAGRDGRLCSRAWNLLDMVSTVMAICPILASQQF
jgi:hypothetical protein